MRCWQLGRSAGTAEARAGGFGGTARIGTAANGHRDFPGTANSVRVEGAVCSLAGNIGFGFRRTAADTVGNTVILGSKRAAMRLFAL